MIHSLNVEVAKKLGVNAALIVANLTYLQANREAQGGDKYFIDGRWWVHHTFESLVKVHPYFSLDQIRRIMKKLLEEGAVFRRQPDSWSRDSYWSVATEFMQSAKSPDRSGEIAGSQVAKSPVVLHDNNIEQIHSKRASEFDFWWAKYPKKVDKKKAQKKFMSMSTSNVKACLADDLSHRYKEIESRFIPNPTTYLNGERWEDEIDTVKTERAPYL